MIEAISKKIAFSRKEINLYIPNAFQLEALKSINYSMKIGEKKGEKWIIVKK